jgi:hypothetical protein
MRAKKSLGILHDSFGDLSSKVTTNSPFSVSNRSWKRRCCSTAFGIGHVTTTSSPGSKRRREAATFSVIAEEQRALRIQVSHEEEKERKRSRGGTILGMEEGPSILSKSAPANARFWSVRGIRRISFKVASRVVLGACRRAARVSRRETTTFVWETSHRA